MFHAAASKCHRKDSLQSYRQPHLTPLEGLRLYSLLRALREQRVELRDAVLGVREEVRLHLQATGVHHVHKPCAAMRTVTGVAPPSCATCLSRCALLHRSPRPAGHVFAGWSAPLSMHVLTCLAPLSMHVPTAPPRHPCAGWPCPAIHAPPALSSPSCAAQTAPGG